MSKLKKIIQNVSAGLVATALSFSSTHAQNNEQKEYLKNNIEISAGNQDWKDAALQNFYWDIFMIEGGYSRQLNKKSDIGIFAEVGSIDKEREVYEDVITNNFKYTALNLKLKTKIFTSQDNNTHAYLKGGVKKIVLLESTKVMGETGLSDNIKNRGLTLGYLLGLGIETRIVKNFSGFAEINASRGKVPIGKINLESGGIKLSAGLKYNFNLSKKK